MSRCEGENRRPACRVSVIFIVNRPFLRFNKTKIFDLQWVAGCVDSGKGLADRDPVTLLRRE